ncbi:hypothetical protein G7B40_031500 [Aetokthonos hydrillicola Thurmond2011]|uniref:Uncharacterized protein n=1 Tax=Aetokthonos hydrillicola Thurmond2011 TaxID=2712845 RepID=A0AAP5IF88_9CYAN|nr:hypothetical protein [Aetokthonos hydrillicola]MBO3462855.1 hypothetical protein [Aetokthonos hydrillicola CCALA 1050]MBW4590978.1 hypothetical protein [Aetokthonos hydrillicola CCALA 1050]MDR9899052.1 hypothetical protein [Aetokthonos hydrillicola Thurmond2011]
MNQLNQTWGISKVAAPESLATILTKISWKKCRGFQLGHIHFLNISTRSDWVQEYAVVAPWGSLQLHIESLQFSLSDEDLELNTGGTVHTKEELDKVRAMIDN